LATTTIGKLFILYTTMVNSVAMQQQSKCFLCGPIQGYITRTGLGSFSDGFSYYWIKFGFGIRIEEQPALG
jgi:hypothetical protein